MNQPQLPHQPVVDAWRIIHGDQILAHVHLLSMVNLVSLHAAVLSLLIVLGQNMIVNWRKVHKDMDVRAVGFLLPEHQMRAQTREPIVAIRKLQEMERLLLQLLYREDNLPRLSPLLPPKPHNHRGAVAEAVAQTTPLSPLQTING